MPSRLRTASRTRISFFSFQDIITSVTGILILVTLILTLYLSPNALLVDAARRSDPQRAELRSLTTQLRQTREQSASLQARLDEVSRVSDDERIRADCARLRTQLPIAQARLRRATAALDEERAAAAARARAAGLETVESEIVGLQTQTLALRTTNALLEATLRQLEEHARQLARDLARALRNTNQVWLIPEPDFSGKRPLLFTLSGRTLAWERFDDARNRREVPAAEADERFPQVLAELNTAQDAIVFYVRPSGIACFERCRTTARNAGFDVGYDALEEQQEVHFSPLRTE
jgi:hypothetical protein